MSRIAHAISEQLAALSLFIDVIGGHISSILCEINFRHIYLSPTLNATSKNNGY